METLQFQSGPRWPLNAALGLVMVWATSAAEYFCSPSGTARGAGSRAEPWDLPTAIAPETPARPGDTIWLLPGTYRGNFQSHLTGTADRPFTLRGERPDGACIDGLGETYPIVIRGAHTVYRDLEVIQSSTWHPSAETPVAIQCLGSHIRLVNLVIHDAGQGIGAWMEAHDLEVYGCLIYHNGIRPLEHGIYAQNDARTGTKRFIDNVIFNNAGFGIHAYTKAGQLTGLHFIGNILFNNGTKRGPGEELDNLFVGGTPPADHIVARDNLAVFTADTRRNNVRFSYQDHRNNPHGTLVAANNYLVGGTALVAEDWRLVTFTNNLLASSTTLIQIRPPPRTPLSAYQWNLNSYFGAAAFSLSGGLQHFNEWTRTTGFDAQSAHRAAVPPEYHLAIRTNRYDPHRATIAVVNWPYSNAIPVKADAILQPGVPFELRNVQDYFGPPVLTGIFDGQPVWLPLTNLAAASPRGPAPPPQTTSPFFNVFMLRALPSPARLP